MSRRCRKAADAHVRIYRWELETPAYRSLSTDARALLVEMRSLYDGRDNRIYMSIREMQRRLCIGQRRAQHARDQLLDRGFAVLLVRGAFHRKIRHASEYALTHEPLDGEITPKKDYMRWTPGDVDGSQDDYRSQKNTVAKMTDSGSRDDYRGTTKLSKKPTDGSRDDCRDGPIGGIHGSHDDYTGMLPRGGE